MHHGLSKREAKKLEKDAYRKLLISVDRGDDKLGYGDYADVRDFLRGKVPVTEHERDYIAETLDILANYK